MVGAQVRAFTTIAFMLSGFVLLAITFKNQEQALELKRVRAELTATIAERRECGKNLDWCHVVTKGTCDWIADRLHASEMKGGR